MSVVERALAVVRDLSIIAAIWAVFVLAATYAKDLNDQQNPAPCTVQTPANCKEGR